MTRLLVSVRNLEEARLAVAGGADIVDLKEPARGALGAVPLAVAREVVRALGASRPVSATVGDLPMQPETVGPAVREMGDTGVAFVKIGFFGAGDGQACIRALKPHARRLRLVAVLFADQDPDFSLLEPLRDAGFAGVMLDTAGKGGLGLRDWVPGEKMAYLIASARELGLITGLAGSLKVSDIPALLPLAPDYLGFRGALCAGGNREKHLDISALRDMRATLPRREDAAERDALCLTLLPERRLAPSLSFPVDAGAATSSGGAITNR